MQMRARNRTTQPLQSTGPVTPSVVSNGSSTPSQPNPLPNNPPPPNASAAPVGYRPLGLYDPLPGPEESDLAAPRRLEVYAQSCLREKRRLAKLNIFSDPEQQGQGPSNNRDVQQSHKDVKGKGRQREPSQDSEHRTDFSPQRSPSYDDAMDTGEDAASLNIQTPTRQHVLPPQVPAAPLRPSHRRPPRASSLPLLGVAGSSRYTGMRPIHEEDEDMSDATSSFQVPQTEREENLSFTHMADLRRSSVDSELEVANMLYPRSADIDRRQMAPQVQVAQPQQQVQPTPPNYPQNAALRRAPTLLIIPSL